MAEAGMVTWAFVKAPELSGTPVGGFGRGVGKSPKRNLAVALGSKPEPLTMVKVPPGATVATVGVVVGATAATGAAESPATQAIVSASSPFSTRFMNLAGYP